MTEHITWCTKVTEDRIYRRKLQRSVSIIFCCTSLGFFYGNLGPALPDIQLLTGQSLDTISWLFTATSAGSLVGTLICGHVCDRVGPQLVLFVSLMLASVLTGVFIYCPSFTAMLVVRVFTGIFIGGVDLAGIASVTELWKSEARPFIHCVQVMLSTGGILSPIIIEPFLGTRSREYPIPNDGNASFHSDASELIQTERVVINSSQMTETSSNGVAYSIQSCLLELDQININASNNVKLCHNVSANILKNKTGRSLAFSVGETKIQYAFIIFAAVGVLASLILFAFIITGSNERNEKQETHKLNKEASNIKRIKYNMSNKLKYLLLFIVTVQFYLVAAMCFKCYAFLPSFYILQFDWSASLASLAMSVFWIGRTVTGVVGIFLAAQFKQSILIPCFSLIYVLASLCLIIAGFKNILSLAWASSAFLGIGLSILFPSLFALTEENIVHVSGRVASLYLVSFTVGGMLDPLYTGYLMDHISPMVFVYLLFGQSLCFLILFVLLKFLLWKFGQRQNTGFEIEIQPMKNLK